MYSKRKLISALVLFMFCFFTYFSMPSSVLASDMQLADSKGHWAYKETNDWYQNGLIKGYEDGTFKPDKLITRAEFVTLINGVFNITKTQNINFTDVVPNDWYYQEIAKANNAGFLSGYQDNTVKPNNQVTRQEVAAIVSKVLSLTRPNNTQELINTFKDKSNIANWSKDVVASVVAKGYMKGYADKTFKGAKFITRAEAIVTLDRVVGNRYFNKGVYGPETGLNKILGNVTLTRGQITLQNTQIIGGLILIPGILNEEITLTNVQVTGDVIVKGGGSKGINLENCTLNNVIVKNDDNEVRLIAKGLTSINKVNLESKAKLEEDSLKGKGFIDVTIINDGKVSKNDKFKNSVEEASDTSKWVDKEGNIIWPKNDGFAGNPEKITLQPGTRIDRYGYEGGRFVCPEGIPSEMRSLAPGTELKPYNVYELIKPVECLGGKSVPWFDQPGGGIQYKLNQTIQELLDGGFIRKVGP